MEVDKEKEIIERVKKDWKFLENVEHQTEAICIEAVKINGMALQYVRDQTYLVCLYAIKENAMAVQFVNWQTEDICLDAIKSNPMSLKYIKFPTLRVTHCALELNHMVLEYVLPQYLDFSVFYRVLRQDGMLVKKLIECEDETIKKKIVMYDGKTVFFGKEELYLIAVAQNGLALQFIKDQTFILCLIAVSRNGLALEFVQEQNEEICVAAVMQNPLALKYVKVQTMKICFAATISENPSADRHMIESIDYKKLISLGNYSQEEYQSLFEFVSTLRSPPQYHCQFDQKLCSLSMILQHPEFIQYIKFKREELCLLAVAIDPFIIGYINDQTLLLALIACSRNSYSSTCIHDKLRNELAGILLF